MATKVSYRQGSKATYLSLLEKSPYTLYFCTDTKELFKGNDLYSDGLRIVENRSSLPAFEAAADGILYFCNDSGCGYVLNNARNGWLAVIHGVDGETIDIDENDLMYVKSISIGTVIGLTDRLNEIEAKIVGIATNDTPGIVMGSDEIVISAIGKMSIGQIPQEKILGLEERLTNIEKTAVGGVHYRGAVETFEQLPESPAVGDLYEVYADNTEWCWNGEKWFKYGETTDISNRATKEEVRAIAQLVDYEISSKPKGTLVNYFDKEIRVMCPADTKWEKQNVGATGNANMYYMGFKAYAPEGAVSFKEGANGVIDDEMFTFDDAFAGTDEYGRNYSICWLALASYDETSDTWTYFGKNSTINKYIGWDYVVEWYDAGGILIASDSIRINLSNENCHTSAIPSYAVGIQSSLDSLEESCTWGDI